VGIICHTVAQPHLPQKFCRVFFDPCMDAFPVCLIIWLFFRQQFFCQHNILQSRILGKQVEGLKNQSKMQPFFTDFRFLLGNRII
jgi:hypothetical protein